MPAPFGLERELPEGGMLWKGDVRLVLTSGVSLTVWKKQIIQANKEKRHYRKIPPAKWKYTNHIGIVYYLASEQKHLHYYYYLKSALFFGFLISLYVLASTDRQGFEGLCINQISPDEQPIGDIYISLLQGIGSHN